MLNNDGNGKEMNVQWYWGYISFDFMTMDKQVADIFIKPLSEELFFTLQLD